MPLGARNFGVPGDTAGDVLLRIRSGELDSAAPGCVVFLAGTNDLGGGASIGATVDLVTACVREVGTRYPAATIVLLGLLPRGDGARSDPRIGVVNDALARFARSARIAFADVTSRFADERGVIRARYYEDDGLHVSALGYRALAAALRETLAYVGIVRHGDMRIRALMPEDRAAWLAMYRAYASAVESAAGDEVAYVVWTWLCGGTHGVRGAIAWMGEAPAGFAHYRAFPRTLDGNEAGYLDDLFVIPNYRSTGLARALIAYVCAQGRAAGWSEIRWVTTPQNVRARRLYDDVAEASELTTYRLSL